jgi:hypothetical protein
VKDINNRVNTALAIVLIAVAVMLLGGVVATTTGPATTLQKAFAQSQRPDKFLQGSDRCVSFQFSNGDAAITCIIPTDGINRKVVNERINELRDACQELKEQGIVDKCSDSQTGNGVFCNWVRVKGGEWVAVFRSGLSCSEIRHIQKDILDQIT